jgi:hypothetical protein
MSAGLVRAARRFAVVVPLGRPGSTPGQVRRQFLTAGRVEFTTRRGQDTTVTVRLPLTPAPAEVP